MLLKSCDNLVAVAPSSSCAGCHLGPRACAFRNETTQGPCQLAIWSTDTGDMMTTTNTTVRMISGEPGCKREVRVLTVGGGGGSELNRAGGGSGQVVNGSFAVTANKDIGIIVGLGGEVNQDGGSTFILAYDDEGNNITATGGQKANLNDGGEGYSGGGAYGSAGGTNGGDGSDYGDGSNFKGGVGSGLNITSMEWVRFSITAGEGGEGNVTSGGGGGGGVLVNGLGPPGHQFQGQGYGGGGSGYNQTVSGLPGCAVLEIIPLPQFIFNETKAQP